ncbi:MAG: hypothetical protein AAFR87_26010 [Bacteroidota bacterium]
MRFLTIVMAIIFLAFSCKDKSTSPLRKRKANKILLGSRKADSITWKLVKIYDPYSKGYTILKDSANYKYLRLMGDGSFNEFDIENKSHGRWYLNKERRKLGFIYSNRNGIDINTDLQNLFFRYHIDTIYKDTLILSIQGRHGMVKQFYQLPHSTLQSDSLNSDTLFLPKVIQDASLHDSVKQKVEKH